MEVVILGFTALLAGAVNAVAGGGTLITFPALLGVLPDDAFGKTLANGTSKVALMPGSVASAWGYRQELRHSSGLVLFLLVPCLIGGVLGTLLITRLDPAIFAGLVPWLILTAVLLLMLQQPLARWFRGHAQAAGRTPISPTGKVLAIAAQFLVAVYGGYFGAGIGILMLTTLGFLGLQDIHHANALKNLLAALINAISSLTFVLEGRVHWSYALSMAVGAIIGGYFGARLARRISAPKVRLGVIVIGLLLAAYYFQDRYYRGD